MRCFTHGRRHGTHQRDRIGECGDAGSTEFRHCGVGGHRAGGGMAGGDADEQRLRQRLGREEGEQRLDPIRERTRGQHGLEHDRFHLRALRERAGDAQPLGHGFVGRPTQIVHEAGCCEPVVREQVHHHHPEAGAGGDERDVAVHLDEMEAQVAGGALERRHRALRKRAAQREFPRIVAERRAVVANDLRIAGNEPPVGRERERVDLEELQVLHAGDLRQAGGVAREPRGEIAREQPGEIGIERVGADIGFDVEENTDERLGGFDLRAALRGDEKLKALAGAVDADRKVDFTRDRHRFLEEERHLRIAEGGADLRPRLRELAEIGKPAHEAALAAAAFQHLRLEHEPRPWRRFGRQLLARPDEHAARDGQAVAAQQGFPVDLGQAHNMESPRRARAVRRIPSDLSMPDPAFERLPFLDAEPWRVVVINPTGRYARNQVAGLIAAGTPLVGGVALGRGGESLDGLPLYDRIADVPERPNIAVLYTPAEGVRDAIARCAAQRIRTIVAAAEHVPVHDALAAAACARAAGAWLVGPNTLGLNVPGRGLLGSIAPSFCKPGRLAMIARSGTLTLAMVRQLTLAGIGQSLVAHIGGDTVAGRNPHEYLAALAHDRASAAVLYCGEIGGDKEYALAEAVRGYPKPVVAMMVGRYAPAEKRMGHAGALIGSARESAAAKLEALAAAGCRVAQGPEQAVAILTELGLAQG